MSQNDLDKQILDVKPHYTWTLSSREKQGKKKHAEDCLEEYLNRACTRKYTKNKGLIVVAWIPISKNLQDAFKIILKNSKTNGKIEHFTGRIVF